MKAHVLTASNDARASWKPTTLPDKTPGPGEVLVRVRAASLNYRDLMIARGKYGGPAKADLVPLADGAGEIAALGAGVTEWKIGDRVIGAYFPEWIAGPVRDELRAHSKGTGSFDGTLAELATFPARGVTRIPAHLSFAEAATIPCAGVTAFAGLFTVGPRLAPGATVVVQGTGGVSLFAAQLALAAGYRVIATSSSAKKLERVRALGVTDVIDTRAEPEWQKVVLDATGGIGADHVLDVGGTGTLPRSFQAVRVGGTISLIGLLSGAGAELDPLPILFRNIRVQGFSVGSVHDQEALGHLLEARKITPIVDEVFPFERAPEALAKLEDGAHFGKIVVAI